MAAFSADAIGFYLQAEDQLTPTLATAAANYQKFVGQIEKWNRRLYDVATHGMGHLGAFVAGWKQLPQQVSQGYSAALKALQAKIKPISQPLNLVFQAKDRKLLSQAIAQAVSKALAGALIRLGVTFPKKRLGYFDTSFSLRTLYSYMAQPPDMTGRLEPRKFAKGGIADGPGGVDQIPALLTKGEMVLTPEVTDKLMDALADVGAGGAPVGELSTVIADIENLSGGLGKLKEAIDAGLGSPADIRLYDKGVTQLADKVATLTDMAGNLSYATRVRLAPSIKDATGRLNEFTEAGEENTTVMQKLLGKVIGPARFLAISKAVDSLSDTFSQLQGGASDAFSQLEGDQTESFVANMNQLNRMLGLSRSELREFKKEAGELAGVADLNVNEMSEALEGMAEAGMRDRRAMLALTPAVTRMAKASTAQVNTLGEAAYRLSDALDLTDGQVASTFNNIRMFSQNSASDAEQLVQDMQANIAALGPALLKETEADRAAILTNMARLGASLSDNWAGSTDQMTGLLSRAMGGEIEAMQQVSLTFGKTQAELQEAFKKGDLTGMLDGLAGKIQMLTATGQTAALESLRETLGFEGTAAEFALLGKNVDKINGTLDKLGGMQGGVDDVAGAMSGLAEGVENNTTAFEWFQKKMGQLTAKEIPGLNFSVAEVIDGIKEFGPTSILAIGMLAKMGGTAVLTGGKLLGLGKVFGKMGGMLSFGKKAGGAATAIGSIGKAAGGAAGAVGSGGFFAGLAAGMTTLAGGIAALGAVLLSPPGIAFSVTLIVAILAIAAAARIATPALKVLGKVVETAMGAAVDAFGLAVPLFQTFIETAGEVFLGTLDRMVLVFKELTSANPANLVAMGPALLSVAAGLGSLAAAVIALGAAFGTAALGVGAFRLASGGSELSMGLAGALDAIVGDMAVMASGPAMVEAAKKQTYAAVGFVDAYGHLLNAIEDLPGGGLLSGIFGDDPAEKIREHATSIARALGDMRLEFDRATSLRQKSASAAFTPAQIETVINAVAEAGLNDAVQDEMRQNNTLLRQILSAIMSGNDLLKVGAGPTEAVTAGPKKTASPFTREVANFAH